MDWAGWAVFGLMATMVLTAVMVTAQLAGITRLDIPMLLGSVMTEDPDRARAIGFIFHLLVGQCFALGYAFTFTLVGRASWWVGGILGLLHVAIALTVLVPLLAAIHPHMATNRAGRSTSATLEPPGLLGLHYGSQTPVVALVAHIAYGVALGLLLTVH